METFLKEAIEGQNFELLIDAKIFSKDIILKSAYNFLDKGYFFFRHDDVQNIILQFTKKSDVDTDPKIIIGEYSDELLDVYLRDKLEKDNKVIREAIVEKAINGPLDTQNFVSLDTG
jgi:His-Xaa-Ser system protein HxsD